MMKKKLFLFWDGWSVENEVKSTFQPNSSFNSFNLKLKSIHSRAAAADDGALNEGRCQRGRNTRELSWDFFLFPFWVWFSFSSRVTHNSESGLNDLYSSFQLYSLCAALDSVFFMCRVNDDDWKPEEGEKKCWKMWRDWLFKHELWNENGAKWSMGEKCILILYTVERTKRIKANVKGRFVWMAKIPHWCELVQQQWLLLHLTSISGTVHVLMLSHCMW